MRRSTSSWQRWHSHQPLYSWVSSTCQICAGNTAERKWPRGFLECLEDSFLTNTMVNEPKRDGARLFVGKERLVGDVMINGHLGQRC